VGECKVLVEGGDGAVCRGNSGHVATRSQMRGGGGGWGPKTRNRTAVAQFRACCVKQQWIVVEDGGEVARTMQQWLWDGAFANAKQKRGLGAKNPKQSCGGSVLGLPCKTAVEGGEGRWCGGL
jgi:hypothetical protein